MSFPNTGPAHCALSSCLSGASEPTNSASAGGIASWAIGPDPVRRPTLRLLRLGGLPDPWPPRRGPWPAGAYPCLATAVLQNVTYGQMATS